MKNNNKKGFTFVEVIFVLIIIAILAVVSIPLYRGYVKKGIAAEGRNLLSDINTGEQSYKFRTGVLYATSSPETQNTKLGVDFRKNKYFTSYTITKNDTTGSYTAVTSTYKGKNLTLVGSLSSKPVIIDNFTSEAD